MFTRDYTIDANSGWVFMAAVLAIAGGILTYYLFVAAKQDPKSKFLKWLKNFLAFKTMWIETILKITYYILTIFVILHSFGFIGIDFAFFILSLIIGPVTIRIVYEMAIMFIMIWHNTQDIANNTSKKK